MTLSDIFFQSIFNTYVVHFRLSKRISVASKSTDFSIDRSFELALFVWNEGNKTALTHNDAFCTSEQVYCASYPKKIKACVSLFDFSSTAIHYVYAFSGQNRPS